MRWPFLFPPLEGVLTPLVPVTGLHPSAEMTAETTPILPFSSNNNVKTVSPAFNILLKTYFDRIFQHVFNLITGFPINKSP